MKDEGMDASNAAELKEKYEEIARSLDYNTTACDYNLRELEIDTAAAWMKDGDRVLDVGCGLGYAVTQYALRHKVEAHGLDYAENMVAGARQLLEKNFPQLKVSVTFVHASVCQTPFPDNHFDVVSSSRCLMALLDWELQKEALKEIHRILKPGGVMALMEGTMEGLERLNEMRSRFGLPAIDATGKDRLFTRKFVEAELLEYCGGMFALEKIQRFGMYYFLTRVAHPLLAAPESPKYDAKINDIARAIAKVIPDYEGLGHLAAFMFRKKT